MRIFYTFAALNRRDARVVEEARLESVYTCQRVSGVRIPIPPLNSFTEM